MSQESEIAYLCRRAGEERLKAEQAPDPMGYHLHTNLARNYERRLIAAQRHLVSLSAIDGADTTDAGGTQVGCSENVQGKE